MKDDLDVQVTRDPEGKLHVRVEAWGETAQHIQDAIDLVNSRREQLPPPEDENDK